MEIEILYVDGCPHVSGTVSRVQAALEQRGVVFDIKEINVADHEAAREYRFIGSPTVRINGLDIEPAARQRTGYGMMCRMYEGVGIPSEALIRSAITEALSSSSR